MEKIKIAISPDEIADFCQRWQIQELSLFGSVLDERFQSDSDVDVLVAFKPGVVYSFRHLIAIQEELEKLFGRPVDLIDKQAIQESPNYLRRHNILNSAQIVYAQR